MSKTTKIIIVVLLLAVLLLGVGYAAIQNITLNISGTAAADPKQSNFKVMFTGTPEVSDSNYVTAGITDETNATINVSGLTTKGQVVSATYIVQNTSTDLSADLSVTTTNSNTDYFTISSQLENTSLTAGEAATVTLSVELTKTPVSDSVSSTIGVQLTAVPVQPGEEGSSGTTNDYSQTPEPTLALVTNANIGDYIDLGNDIIGTDATTDDWRILYKDGNIVYVILADLLPAAKVPSVEGLNTNTNQSEFSEYGVFGTYNAKEEFLSALKNTTAWSSFTNGITGATAIGTPTVELILNSYNAKNGTELEYTGATPYPTVDSSTKDFDLYAPNTNWGYKLASHSPEEPERIIGFNSGGFGYRETLTNISTGIRPVVSIPSFVEAEEVNGVWVISDTK